MAMQEAGQLYLPKEPMEDVTAYARRLARSVLFNQYGRTITNLSSMPFKAPVVLGEETDTLIEGLQDDVDNEGTNITQFARWLLRDLIHFGKAHFLVDYPVVTDELTLADEQERGIRPYLSHIDPYALIGWRAVVANGREQLSEIRIRQTTVEPNGEFGEREIDVIRQITPTSFTEWRKPKEKDDSEFAVVAGPYLNTLGKIALVTIYANRKGILASEPVLLDLANMNLRHWQSQSDQDNILHVARVPILFGSGMQKDGI